ncbi:MAG: 5-(carboxyamino)imidazole ribonucleotide synthase, partial [Candidatus Eremiobacteraeota bacterium]|nr:5-(carboxyamino)imidazole ribonucleotide synthase [Candidatus Eremiobacteraeota bacterium]
CDGGAAPCRIRAKNARCRRFQHSMIKTIGVIGGGQLGRMFTLDAKRMGYDVIALDPQENSPCGQVADSQIIARYDDLQAVEQLGLRSDVVTYEFENIAIESVEHLERGGCNVTPASGVLRITQDRLLEKRFVRECGIATADFDEIATPGDIERAAASVGFPAVLKTVRGGYDGKGQWRVYTIDEARAALSESKGVRLIWERAIAFERELSVIATRGYDDNVITYAVAENEHDSGVLAMTLAPARIEERVAMKAREMATIIGRSLGIVGTYCVEFFLTQGAELLVNEIAPRPHNSGHYTIDVTQCSQYEQHVRAICELPLSEPQMLRSAIMMNVLGTGTGDRLDGVYELLGDPDVVLHLYGKRHAVARRKMGHFTMLVDGELDDAAIVRARQRHSRLRWVP